jgi:predicted amidohydrolase
MAHARSIAVAQTCPVPGDVQANLREHVRLARLAGEEGAGIVVFPELSLTGYELDHAERLAFSEEDQRLLPLLDAASATSAILVVGAPVRLDGRLHIGAFIVSPDGAVDLYTKQRLGAFGPGAAVDGVVPAAEATVFEPGDRDPLVRYRGGTAALAVCADAGRPEHARAAAARGATAYLASMFVIPSELEADAARLRRYAVAHGMVVALANFGASTGGLASGGRSTIWTPAGEPLVQLAASGSGVAVAAATGDGWSAKRIMLDGR